ncbi:hypothetical protein Pmani_003137 [Petrolisthes manimaculis]|uniref:Uncharacterized protein n=1 Tax=Petrolisthes manimaculis TaxID=1843537 RepID=A0AAE1UIS2_9EUCA|nr:hypothetical protein Pmani_003137 [Petrolisthes manimaculis]
MSDIERGMSSIDTGVVFLGPPTRCRSSKFPSSCHLVNHRYTVVRAIPSSLDICVGFEPPLHIPSIMPRCATFSLRLFMVKAVFQSGGACGVEAVIDVNACPTTSHDYAKVYTVWSTNQHSPGKSVHVYTCLSVRVSVLGDLPLTQGSYGLVAIIPQTPRSLYHVTSLPGRQAREQGENRACVSSSFYYCIETRTLNSDLCGA